MDSEDLQINLSGAPTALKWGDQIITEPRQRLLITVHGIRDYGAWQERLGAAVESEVPDATCLHYHYGYLSVFAFVIPVLRWLVIWRFRDWLRTVLQGDYSRVDIIAHSFGTYLVGCGLRSLNGGPGAHVHTVILAGSVLKSTFPWEKLLARGVVKRVVNECGTRDWPLLFSQFFVLFTGMGGRSGFHGGQSERFRNRFHVGYGHGDYFTDEFWTRWWMPLLKLNGPVAANPLKPSDVTVWDRIFETLAENSEPLKLSAYCALTFVFVAAPFWTYRQQQLERAKTDISVRTLTTAQLSEQSKLTGLDLAEVHSYLISDMNKGQVPASSPESLESSELVWTVLRQLEPESQPPTEVKQRLARLAEVLSPKQESLLPVTRHVYALARHLADPHDAAALEYFNEAGSLLAEGPRSVRALCRYEEGRAAAALENAERARECFQSAEEIAGTEIPFWLQISLQLARSELDRKADKAAAREQLQLSADLVRRKLAAGTKDHAEADKLNERLADIHNRLAWLAMDDFAKEEAQRHFEAGQQAADAVQEPTPRLRILHYHLRHGLGLVKRFSNAPAEEVVTHFTSLVEEMQSALANSDDFTPNQRLGVRLRIANSMERRADTVLFRPDPQPRLAAPLFGEAEAFVRRQEQMQDDAGRSTQARLLAKLAIANALADDLSGSQACGDLAETITLPPNVRAKLEIWFQAAKSFRQLKIPGESATGRQELEKLVGRGSDGKASLSREEKELQLLAAQTLRDLGSEPGSEQPTPQVAERVRSEEPRMDANKRE